MVKVILKFNFGEIAFKFIIKYLGCASKKLEIEIESLLGRH